MNNILISDDKAKFPVEQAIELLHTSYWAETRDPDVIINEKYRGQGIGKKLISTIMSDNRFSSLLGILVTRDAHGLYEHFGFKRDCERAMTRRVK